MIKLAKLYKLLIIIIVVMMVIATILLGHTVFSGEDKITNDRSLLSVGYSTALGLFLTIVLGFAVIIIALARRYYHQRKYGDFE